MMRRFSIKKAVDPVHNAASKHKQQTPGVAECGELEVEVIKLRRAVARRHEIDHEKNAREANQIFFLKQLHEDIRIAYEDKDKLQNKVEEVAEPRVEKMKFKYQALCQRKESLEAEIEQTKKQTRELELKREQVMMDVGNKKLFLEQLAKFAAQVRKRQQYEQSQHDERRIELRQAQEIIPLMEQELNRLTKERDKLKAPPPEPKVEKTKEEEEDSIQDKSDAKETTTGIETKEEPSKAEEVPPRRGRPGLEKRMSQRQIWKKAVREARKSNEFSVDTVDQDRDATPNEGLEDEDIMLNGKAHSAPTNWREAVKQARVNIEDQEKEENGSYDSEKSKSVKAVDKDPIVDRSPQESLFEGDDTSNKVENELSYHPSIGVQAENQPNEACAQTKIEQNGTRTLKDSEAQEENLSKDPRFSTESFGAMII